MPITALPVRRSILEIQNAFDKETDTRTLENLMTAWAGISRGNGVQSDRNGRFDC